MTSATKLFDICSFPFSAQIILHQYVSTFVFVTLNLCMMILMQSWILSFFPIFVAVGKGNIVSVLCSKELGICKSMLIYICSFPFSTMINQNIILHQDVSTFVIIGFDLMYDDFEHSGR